MIMYCFISPSKIDSDSLAALSSVERASMIVATFVIYIAALLMIIGHLYIPWQSNHHREPHRPLLYDRAALDSPFFPWEKQ